MQAVPLQLPVERAAADAEQPRGDRLVAAHLLQGPDDVLALDGRRAAPSRIAAQRSRDGGPTIAVRDALTRA